MTLCITHEPNHEITGYRTPITGNFVCDVCGAGYCTCNEDTYLCAKCGNREWDDNCVLGATMLPEILEKLPIGNWDVYCQECYHDVLSKMQPCPNHGGNFDCTPFCPLCGGNQEALLIATHNTEKEEK